MTDHTTHPHTLARAIAANLPTGWQTVETPFDHAARIVGPDGVTIHLRVENYGAAAGRLILSGGVPDGTSYPDADTHGVDTGRITVAADRDPAAIARDVTRRLLPVVVESWATVSDRIARRLNRAATRDTLAAELAGILGSRTYTRRGDVAADLPDRFASTPGVRAIAFGHMAPGYDGESVDVELRGISPDRARELARLIASWPDAAPR